MRTGEDCDDGRRDEGREGGRLAGKIVVVVTRSPRREDVVAAHQEKEEARPVVFG
jgi:hypothetical protein